MQQGNGRLKLQSREEPGRNGRGLGQAVRQEVMLPWNEWNHSETQIAPPGPLLLHKYTIAKDAQ